MQKIRASGALLAASIVVASGLAAAQAARTPAETAQYRHAQFRQLGASFKAVNDGLRRGEPDLAAIRAEAQSIVRLSEALPNWFPAGSGPGAGVRTRAKAEIWSDPAAFAERIRQLQVAARDLSAGPDLAAMRTGVRALGAQCASCHAAFREPE